MSDIGDDFAAMKEAGKERRRFNLEQSTHQLVEHGVEFESKNGGSHLIVKGKGGKTIDFWPSTGLFRVRGETTSHRGVFKLLRVFV